MHTIKNANSARLSYIYEILVVNWSFRLWSPRLIFNQASRAWWKTRAATRRRLCKLQPVLLVPTLARKNPELHVSLGRPVQGSRLQVCLSGQYFCTGSSKSFTTRTRPAGSQMRSPPSWKRTNFGKSPSNCAYRTAKAFAWSPSALQKTPESFWSWSR